MMLRRAGEIEQLVVVPGRIVDVVPR